MSVQTTPTLITLRFWGRPHPHANASTANDGAIIISIIILIIYSFLRDKDKERALTHYNIIIFVVVSVNERLLLRPPNEVSYILVTSWRLRSKRRMFASI